MAERAGTDRMRRKRIIAASCSPVACGRPCVRPSWRFPDGDLKRNPRSIPRSNTLLLIGLGLNVVGTATIFMFAYPPLDERRHRLFLILTRMALILMFCGCLAYSSVPAATGLRQGIVCIPRPSVRPIHPLSVFLAPAFLREHGGRSGGHLGGCSFCFDTLQKLAPTALGLSRPDRMVGTERIDS